MVLLLLVMTGCSGITPDGELRNNREEGPQQGLFSGPHGEFVIIAPNAGKPMHENVDDSVKAAH